MKPVGRRQFLIGARPEALSVELPGTVELVLNTRTARALGLAIPASISPRVTRIIE